MKGAVLLITAFAALMAHGQAVAAPQDRRRTRCGHGAGRPVAGRPAGCVSANDQPAEVRVDGGVRGRLEVDSLLGSEGGSGPMEERPAGVEAGRWLRGSAGNHHAEM